MAPPVGGGGRVVGGMLAVQFKEVDSLDEAGHRCSFVGGVLPVRERESEKPYHGD